RRMVSVTNAALDVNAWIPTHGPPAPTLRLRAAGQDHLVLSLGDAVRVAGADVDRFATGAVAELSPMWLAAIPSAQRFVRQDQLLVHRQVTIGDEEPLALANVGSILATVAGLRSESLSSLGGLDLGGLEGFLRLTDVADRSLFRNAGNEPVALVVAAKELALFLAFSDEEQQVAVSGLHVEDRDLRVGSRLTEDLEELALAVSLDIERERPGHSGTT